jgi:hypothetical protein
MLKQGKTWHRGNQKGSVLLTVVIMVMVLFTLTSVCLDVIHHSTRVSSRNVQKTQAKLTAERVLTEFINGYKAAKEAEYSAPGDEDKKKNLFADLMNDYAKGKSEANPTIIDVSMKNQTTGAIQSDFDDNFGKTELHIYMTGPNSFVVESICTYSTQTQTASVLFATTTKINKVVSHTVESQLGKLIGNNQLTNGIDGSIYIEKNDLDDSTYKKLSRTNLKAHIYSEFSVRFDDAYTMKDMRNTSHGNNDFNCPDEDFDQAPTLICDGYVTVQNDSNVIGTQAGKIDANKNAPGTSGYDASNLGNYDGFVKIDKKLILGKASSIQFGQTDKTAADYAQNQIDLYTHGIILGGIPYGDAGDHNFELEADEIRAVFPKQDSAHGIEEGLWNYQPSGETKIHGNVYAYQGFDQDGNEIDSQDGSVVIMDNINMIVDGDVFVEGNVYFFTSDLNNFGTIECNNFSCAKNIIVAQREYYPADDKLYKIKESTIKTYTVEDGKILDSAGHEATDMYNHIKTKKDSANKRLIFKHVDKNPVRNQFPQKGYDAQTGFVQTDTLGKLYRDCSANDIFTIDVHDSTDLSKDSELVKAAKGNSHKYADAMMRSFTTNGAGDSNPSAHTVATTSKFNYKDPVTNVESVKPVVEDGPMGKYANDGNPGAGEGYCFYNINSSIKLTPAQVTPMGGDYANIHHLGYNIKLEKEDIVIALPLNTPIGAKFRIDRSVRDANNLQSFVYFMYYDPNKMDGDDVAGTSTKYDGDACLYYKDSTDHARKLQTSADFIDDSGNKGVKDYKITPDAADALSDIDGGAAKGAAWMGASNTPTDGVLIGDLDSVDPTVNVNDTTSVADNFRHNTFDKQDGNSVIMYMVPNDVGFTFLKGGNGTSYPGDYSGDAYKNWNGNGSRAWRAQGLIYGLNSNIKLGVFETNTGDDMSGLYGQVKGFSVNFLGDNKKNHKDCSMAEGSLLDYVGKKNNAGGSIASVKLQYYQY